MVGYISSLNSRLTNHYLKHSDGVVVSFALVSVVNYPLFYFVWRFGFNIEKEPFLLRMIATLLCIPLLFKDSFPGWLRSFLPAYWYLTLLFCLPFFATYSFLQNMDSPSWMVNIMLGFLFLVLATDWVAYCFVALGGVAIAVALYYFQFGGVDLTHKENLLSILINIASALFVIAFISRSREVSHDAKLSHLSFLASVLAHELRVPLSSIVLYCATLRKRITGIKKRLQKDYHEELGKMGDLVEGIHNSSKKGFHVIDMLLMYTKKHEGTCSDVKRERKKISEYVKCVVEEYPMKEEERKKIVVRKLGEFMVNVESNYIKHVFFNLLKNSLRYLAEREDGRILITICGDDAGNKVVFFEDNGPGIKNSVLPKIFDPFFTTEDRGTGVGLAFCKMAMQNIGASISCEAKEGEYTRFILEF